MGRHADKPEEPLIELLTLIGGKFHDLESAAHRVKMGKHGRINPEIAWRNCEGLYASIESNGLIVDHPITGDCRIIKKENG